MDTGTSSIYRYTMDDYINWGKDIFIWKQLVRESCPLHWHDHYEIEYIRKGRGRQIFNGVEYQILPGMFHLLTPTDFHEWIVEEEIEVDKFNFQEGDVDPFILNTLIGLCGNTSLRFDGEHKRALDAMFEVCLQHSAVFSDSAYQTQMIKKILECILLDVIEHLGNSEYQREGSFVKTTDNIRRVTVYIHQHFKEQIELKTVAEFAHYSPQYLSKTFHRVLGITFKDYVTNLRMNYASALILNTEMSISDIGHEAGFGTRQNFTKEFKRVYSCSPSEYRLKNQNIKNINGSLTLPDGVIQE